MSLRDDPEAIMVLAWRHKLQKAFLSNARLPPDQDEMPEFDALFTIIEQYQNMSVTYLTFSKIRKVMRRICFLHPNKVPRDDEFRFRDRAKVLMNQWHQLRLNPNPPQSRIYESEDESAAVTQRMARLGLEGVQRAMFHLPSSSLYARERRRRQVTARRIRGH
ncbi:hypothetical protein B0H17DRAFT_1074379 [Mycena rosella]|uniref:Uncharacterized protein n=1 Tax=Mycena rosella TaxID=1033263 RepID=A0AAD7DAY8_MYCRO|nr:hypothetical protein B0H17DRAFT_1074379 [Mycena rosella]